MLLKVVSLSGDMCGSSRSSECTCHRLLAASFVWVVGKAVTRWSSGMRRGPTISRWPAIAGSEIDVARSESGIGGGRSVGYEDRIYNDTLHRKEMRLVGHGSRDRRCMNIFSYIAR